MHPFRLFMLALVVSTLAMGIAHAAKREASGKNPIPEMSEEYLANEDNVALGKEIWIEQCQHCHGAKAYPGKAPKLRPRTYTPEFVYERVTFGFRKMPAWEEVYDENERMSVTAWIMNRKFSP